MPEFSAPIVGYVGFCFLGYALANTEFSLPWRLVIYVLVLPVLWRIFWWPVPGTEPPGLGGLATEYLSVPTIFWAVGGVRVLQISAAESPAGGGSDGSA